MLTIKIIATKEVFAFFLSAISIIFRIASVEDIWRTTYCFILTFCIEVCTIRESVWQKDIFGEILNGDPGV